METSTFVSEKSSHATQHQVGKDIKSLAYDCEVSDDALQKLHKTILCY